ncbi:MAG: hypothetical protein KatS3mg038_1014 [Candidatus Kapaibacterium sp.]|nr:MAG: hypothetical protein KatS3mg038_1014 [Candidatus Kapabacteria bacterium]
MTKPNRYSHIDFTPPEAVRQMAERGLELRRKFGRGGTPIGIARARDLKNGVAVSPETIKRMVLFFARHERDRRPGWNNPQNPTNGYIAYLLWGGAPGRVWAQSVKRLMDLADRNYTKTAAPAVSTREQRFWFQNNSAVKALDGTPGRVGGYLVAFGLPKDQHGEYFTAQTNFYLDWYTSRPVLFHHGMDEKHGLEQIGYVTNISVHPQGLWAEAQLDLSNPLAVQVYELVKQGKLGWSSGSIPHLVRTEADGRITDWPIVEASLTPTPAEPHRTTAVALKSATAQLLSDLKPWRTKTMDTERSKRIRRIERITRHLARKGKRVAPLRSDELQQFDDEYLRSLESELTGEMGTEEYSRAFEDEEELSSMRSEDMMRPEEEDYSYARSGNGDSGMPPGQHDDEYLRTSWESPEEEGYPYARSESPEEEGYPYARSESPEEEGYPYARSESPEEEDYSYARSGNGDSGTPERYDEEYIRSLESELDEPPLAVRQEEEEPYLRQADEDEDIYMRQEEEEDEPLYTRQDDDDLTARDVAYLRKLDQEIDDLHAQIRALDKTYRAKMARLREVEQIFLQAQKSRQALRVSRLRQRYDSKYRARVKALRTLLARRMRDREQIKAIVEKLSRRKASAKSDTAQPQGKTPARRTVARVPMPVDAVVARVMKQIRQEAPPMSRATPRTGDNPWSSKGIGVVSPPSKYADMSHEDMAFMAQLLTDAHRRIGRVWNPSQEFWREYAAKALGALRSGDATFSQRAIKALETIQGIKAVNASTLANLGQEFIAEGWSAQIWEKPRLENPVARALRMIAMPRDPYILPVEGTDPTVYAARQVVSESSLAFTASNPTIPNATVGTANATLTTGKLGLRVFITTELAEDSIIPIIPLVRDQAIRAMENARDFVILNADDTTGTGNINYYGATIPNTHLALYGGGNGFIRHTFDVPSLRIDMGGAFPTLAKLREMRARLSLNLINDLRSLAYFVDPVTYLGLLSIDELNLYMANGVAATVNTGSVPSIDSIPVYVTDQLLPAASDGRVSSDNNNNRFGRILLVHMKSWIGGYRRDITTYLNHQPEFDTYSLTITMRMALARRPEDCAVLLYNIAQ